MDNPFTVQVFQATRTLEQLQVEEAKLACPRKSCPSHQPSSFLINALWLTRQLHMREPEQRPMLMPWHDQAWFRGMPTELDECDPFELHDVRMSQLAPNKCLPTYLLGVS